MQGNEKFSQDATESYSNQRAKTDRREAEKGTKQGRNAVSAKETMG